MPEYDKTIKDALFDVIAWHYDQFYDGGATQPAISMIEEAYAVMHGVEGDARTVDEFIKSELAAARSGTARKDLRERMIRHA